VSVEPFIGTYGPRNAVPSRNAISSKWFTVFCLFAALVGGAWMETLSVGKMSDLLVRGQVVQGEVTELWQTTGKGKGNNVRYTYDLGAYHLQDVERVQDYEYGSFKVGDKVSVTVDPKKPWSHRYGLVTKERLDRYRDNWIWGTLILAGIIQLIYFAVCDTTRRHVRILKDHVAVTARVTGMDKPTGVKAQTQSVHLQYQLPSGVLRDQSISFAPIESAKLKVNDELVLMVNPEDETEIKTLASLTMATIE